MTSTSGVAEITQSVGLGKLLNGDMGALARALTLLERSGAESSALARDLRRHTGRAFVIGFSGPPGAGKSTLINAYIGFLRDRGERVAVLAVDPSSPISGGALLGDRVRMGVHTADDGVFVRSVASRGHLGGLSLAVPMMLDALDAAGWSNIIIETVGSGQSETEIAEFSDVRVVLSAPGLGDDVQALKAGLLEIADVLVVNKSDLPFADRTNSQLRRMLKLRDPDRGAPAVVSTVAAEGRGLEDLHEAITAKRAEFGDRSDEERLAARLDGFVTRSVMAEFASRLSSIDRETRDELDLALRSGQLSLDEIVSTLILRSASLPSTISRSDRSPAADA